MKMAVVQLQQSRDALYQSENMAAFGSLLAGLVHELNNPLSIISAAMLLGEDMADAARALAAQAAKVPRAAERCGRIVRTVLAMAWQRPAQMRAVAIRPVVMEALELLAYGRRTDGIGIPAI